MIIRDSHVVAEVAERSGYPEILVRDILERMKVAIVQGVGTHGRVRLHGFGRWTVRWSVGRSYHRIGGGTVQKPTMARIYFHEWGRNATWKGRRHLGVKAPQPYKMLA